MSYRIQLTVIAFLVMLIGATAQPSPARAGRWFYDITPPLGGQTFDVGPYNSEYGCKDWCGSAFFLHPAACHTHPSDYNCRNIGNGYAYPKGFPYPVPHDQEIPSNCCFRSNQPGMPQGYYFFLYTSAGGSAERCTHHVIKKARSIPNAELGNGCFFVGDTRE